MSPGSKAVWREKERRVSFPALLEAADLVRLHAALNGLIDGAADEMVMRYSGGENPWEDVLPLNSNPLVYELCIEAMSQAIAARLLELGYDDEGHRIERPAAQEETP